MGPPELPERASALCSITSSIEAHGRNSPIACSLATIPSTKVYWGSPAKPLDVERRRIHAIGRIDKLIGTVKELKARVEALEGGAS